LSEEDRSRLIANQDALEFGHTLQDQIGGQIEVGFLISGFYEDRYDDGDDDPISQYISSFIATHALVRE